MYVLKLKIWTVSLFISLAGEAKSSITLSPSLNIRFIDIYELPVWLTYCMYY